MDCMITVYRYPAFDYGTTGVGKWAARVFMSRRGQENGQ